jgi:hypothetical protein
MRGITGDTNKKWTPHGLLTAASVLTHTKVFIRGSTCTTIMEQENGGIAESSPPAVVVEEVLSTIPAVEVREAIDHAIEDAQTLGLEYTLSADELFVLRTYMCTCILYRVLRCE